MTCIFSLVFDEALLKKNMNLESDNNHLGYARHTLTGSKQNLNKTLLIEMKILHSN